MVIKFLILIFKTFDTSNAKLNKSIVELSEEMVKLPYPRKFYPLPNATLSRKQTVKYWSFKNILVISTSLVNQPPPPHSVIFCLLECNFANPQSAFSKWPKMRSYAPLDMPGHVCKCLPRFSPLHSGVKGDIFIRNLKSIFLP